MAYALDPDLVPWLPVLPALDLSDPVAVRAELDGLRSRAPAYSAPPTLEIEDLRIPGPAGAPDVPVRVYRPTDRPGPLPGLLYLHGGGFVIGSIESEHRSAAEVAAGVGVVVASVDYRLAPEHPYPAGLEDCNAALDWLAAKASDLGVDPDRIGIAGESAGAGLAAGLCLLVRDRGGPAVCFQYLGIPELDDRLDTPSMVAFVDTPMWSRPKAEFSWSYYLGGRARDDVPPYAAPARATDLRGLPPAYVSTCEFDPLRDEGIRYAHRLIQAGVPTELHHYPGTFHGSVIAENAAVSRRMIADKHAALARGLRVPTGPAATEG
jgi:acetyl esterase